MKSPFSLLETVRLRFVPTRIADTVALGTDAPDWSETVPTRIAVTDCARIMFPVPSQARPEMVSSIKLARPGADRRLRRSILLGIRPPTDRFDSARRGIRKAITRY